MMTYVVISKSEEEIIYKLFSETEGYGEVYLHIYPKNGTAEFVQKDKDYNVGFVAHVASTLAKQAAKIVE